MPKTDPKGESAGEQRFRLVVEAAPNAMVMIDPAGKIVMVNTQAERVFGYSRAELAGQPVDMLVPERFRSHHPEMRRQFFTDPQPRPMGAGRDLYGLKKDGSEFPVEIGLNPIETDEGTMVLSAIVDITERKASELALRNSEQQYSSLLDGVVDFAIYMLDPNGIVTKWNRGAQRIKGYRAEEIVGQHVSCFYTEEDRAANLPQRALEIATRDARYEAQGWRVRKDGSRFLADVVIDALKDDSGRVIGFAKITRDITERVRAARQLEEARADEALRRAQVELLEARVAERTRIARELHDTLLQSFHGLLLKFQTVSDLLPTRPAEAREILSSAIDQTAQAITEGREAVQGLRASTVERNDLAQAIMNLGEELGAKASSGTTVGLQVDVEGAPRTLHPIVRDEIYRIASEALRNAFRHAQAKQIEVELRYDEQQLRLRIRDDGKGIDPKILTAEEPAGHFGLSGMRERAKLIGGKLTVWSAPESGTHIELNVPVDHIYAGPSVPHQKSSGETPNT